MFVFAERELRGPRLSSIKLAESCSALYFQKRANIDANKPNSLIPHASVLTLVRAHLGRYVTTHSTTMLSIFNIDIRQSYKYAPVSEGFPLRRGQERTPQCMTHEKDVRGPTGLFGMTATRPIGWTINLALGLGTGIVGHALRGNVEGRRP